MEPKYRVAVSDSKGRGAWGVGQTLEEAHANAKKFWRQDFGGRTPPVTLREVWSSERFHWEEIRS